MTYELKKVSVWSVAKISFVLGGVMGFVMGLIWWMMIGLVGSLSLEDFGGEMGDIGMVGLGVAGILLPFMMAMFYAVLMMIANALMTAVYNLFAGFLGGVEVTLNAQQPPVTYAPPPQPYAQPQPPPPQPPTNPNPPPAPPAAG